jgi:hypothetical protein
MALLRLYETIRRPSSGPRTLSCHMTCSERLDRSFNLLGACDWLVEAIIMKVTVITWNQK